MNPPQNSDLQHQIWSDDLVEALTGLEERPWYESKHSRPLTKNSLAHQLKPFKVKSCDIRIGNTVNKGYKRENFELAVIEKTLTHLQEKLTPAPAGLRPASRAPPADLFGRYPQMLPSIPMAALVNEAPGIRLLTYIRTLISASFYRLRFDLFAIVRLSDLCETSSLGLLNRRYQSTHALSYLQTYAEDIFLIFD